MKVILVLSDALRDDIAAQRMGYLEHLVETHLATRYSVRGELRVARWVSTRCSR